MYIGAVRENVGSAMATKRDIELEVAKWLVGARDRAGGRKNRVSLD